MCTEEYEVNMQPLAVIFKTCKVALSVIDWRRASAWTSKATPREVRLMVHAHGRLVGSLMIHAALGSLELPTHYLFATVLLYYFLMTASL